jgi:hypothetical protein
MWWLTFRHGEVVIIDASSLVHARMLAAKHGFGRPAYFAGGHFVDPERAMLIPNDAIGRTLSPSEVWQLLRDMSIDLDRRTGTQEMIVPAPDEYQEQQLRNQLKSPPSTE